MTIPRTALQVPARGLSGEAATATALWSLKRRIAGAEGEPKIAGRSELSRCVAPRRTLVAVVRGDDAGHERKIGPRGLANKCALSDCRRLAETGGKGPRHSDAGT